ncbi:CHAT domain-containing protein [Ephemerocybe angulata]|uniref:CHAT domain-containing protein n=1 Tax=Ephemerocybe angulata TaxID=980116 RepID=A0A8H6LVH8_9AGAR|nr:CHAT domain-containing protein [Tulosesus angulatus]
MIKCLSLDRNSASVEISWDLSSIYYLGVSRVAVVLEVLEVELLELEGPGLVQKPSPSLNECTYNACKAITSAIPRQSDMPFKGLRLSLDVVAWDVGARKWPRILPRAATVYFPQVPPRVWWCPTGPLSFLSLHAAGIYRGSNRESVFDYVVSSYTPTVTTITDRVKSCHSSDGKGSGLFLTSQPNAPGAFPIPGTTKEVRAIFNKAKESGVRTLKLEGDAMTVGECLQHMQDFSSIHLACHGSQNAAEPLQSRFLFHQGSLELGTILQSNLKNADLAFLSACQTSTGQEKLSDEAVHLTAGMLAAGYRRVLGTMWSIGDNSAQEVATTFYEYLLAHRNDSSATGFDGTHSAVALHYATQQLRLSLDNSEHSLLTWIPFVHFGL